jgi:hypothetical protein
METESPEYHPHHRVTGIGFEELVRAGTRDDRDAMLAAHLHRLLRDARHVGAKARLRAYHTVHPDMLDAEIHALLDDLLGDFRIGEDKYRLWPFGDGLEVWIAGVAIKCCCVRVDGAHLISLRLEFAICRLQPLAAYSNADDRDPFGR